MKKCYTFLFGSRIKFDELCHIVVTELKEKYPYIRRIAYLCKSKTACLVGAGARLKQKIKDLTGCAAYVAEYEEIKKSDRIKSVGRVSYVERNQWIIVESYITIIHFEKNYDDNKSGIPMGYDYAGKSKNKVIILHSQTKFLAL